MEDMNINGMVDTEAIDMTATDAGKGRNALTTGLIIGGIGVGSVLLWELVVKPVTKAVKSKFFGQAKSVGMGNDVSNDDEVVE